jgi:hypothetical protein
MANFREGLPQKKKCIDEANNVQVISKNPVPWNLLADTPLLSFAFFQYF